jgi:predicted PurR-regulated permease PerM
MFYFLKDGKQFKELYLTISPLKHGSDDKIFASIKNSINSIMIGSLTVAIAQGIFTGIGLLIFGVPNSFFFGALAGFMAFVPGVGPSLVWFPAAIYLFFTQPDSFVWLYQIIWGVLAVGLIDNFLGPKVMNQGIKIHQLFILLSIIGGITVFGPEGLLFGPLILSVFVSIIKVWNEDKDLQ